MNKPVVMSIVAGVVLLLLMVLTNPSAERHRDQIAESISERSQIEKVFGVGQISAFASRYHSLGILSYSTLGDEVVSVGMLGMVFYVG